MGKKLEVAMTELTFKQKQWLKKLFLDYFPHVCTKSYPLSIFEKYFKFAENNHFLTLPQHLQCPENEKNPKPVIKVGLDIPKMVADKDGPFFSLIKNGEYLEEIKEKAEKNVFNIFDYLVKKKYGEEVAQENCRFLEEFCEMFSSCNVNVPDLFFKEMGRGNRGISAEYKHEEKCFQWDYTWDFSYPTPLLSHTPRVIVSDISTSRPGAFQYFARKLYSILGSRGGNPVSDYIFLIIEFFKQLEKDVEFYRDIRSGLIETNATNSKNKERKERIRFLFESMVHYELEGVGKDDKIGRNIMYVPVKYDSLTEKIKSKGNQKELEKYANEKLKLFIPKEYTTKAGHTKIQKMFTKEEYNFVRDTYNEICKYLEYDHLSEKSKVRLRDAARDNKNDQLLEMYKLLHDHESQNFLKTPMIQKILTDKIPRSKLRGISCSSQILE